MSSSPRSRRSEKNSNVACFFSYVNALYDQPAGGSGPFNTFLTCRKAVIKVLGRCEVLRRQRGGPGVCGGPARRVAHASAASCSFKYRQLGRKSRNPASFATCEPLPTGARFVLKKARGGKSLTKLLKPPRLILAMPKAAEVAADSTIDVTWTATA